MLLAWSHTLRTRALDYSTKESTLPPSFVGHSPKIHKTLRTSSLGPTPFAVGGWDEAVPVGSSQPASKVRLLGCILQRLPHPVSGIRVASEWSVTLAGMPGAWALSPEGAGLQPGPIFPPSSVGLRRPPPHSCCPICSFSTMHSPALHPAASHVPPALTHQRHLEQMPQVFPGSPILVRPDGLLDVGCHNILETEKLP